MKLRRSLTALALTSAVVLGGLAASAAPAQAATWPVTSLSSMTYARQQAATCRGILNHIAAMKENIATYPDYQYAGLWYTAIHFDQMEYHRLGCERFAPLG